MILQRTMFLLLILTSTFSTAFGQDKLIIEVPFSKIEKDVQATVKSGQTEIHVTCKDEAEARTVLPTLSILKDAEHAGVQEAYIKPSPNLLDKTTIVFDVKDALGDDEKTWIFVVNKKNKGKIHLVKKEAPNPNPPVPTVSYVPQIPSGVDILNGVTLQSQNTVFSDKNYLDVVDKKRVNSIVYSLCDNRLSFEQSNSKKLRLHVGAPVSFQLNPVPNPLRYNVTVSSKYNDFNIEDPTGLLNYLSPDALISKLQSGGSDADLKSAKDRKEKILGYLYRINSQLNEFLNYYKYTADCVDPAVFVAAKNAIRKKINDLLSSLNLNYPGSVPDWIAIEFNTSDSAFVKPILHTYQTFEALNISPYHLQIGRLKNADELSINLKVKPRENIDASYMVDSVDFDFPIYGGFKVDVSPGLFYSFFTSNQYTLYNDSMSVKGSGGQDSVTDRFKSIQKEKIKKGDIGISALLHFYPRISKDVNVSANIGMGVTIADKPELRYLAGFSLLLGRVNRFGISAGWAFGKVEDISDRYRDGSSFKKVNMSETKLDTKKSLQSGAFIALSYNIPLIKRKAESKDNSASSTSATKPADKKENSSSEGNQDNGGKQDKNVGDDKKEDSKSGNSESDKKSHGLE